MKRILALVLAVGMVAGALSFRSRIEDAPLAGPGNPPGTAGELTLTCDVGLEDVCEAVADEADVGAVAEAPAAVADRLVDPAGEELRGAWLTLDPWVEVAALRLESAGEATVLGDGTPLARSPLVAAVWEERAAALESACGTLTWRCVGDVAAGSWADIGAPEAWGRVKVGRAEGADAAEAMLLLGQIAAGYAGGGDVSRADVEGNAFFAWLSRLEEARPPLPPGLASPIEAMVQRGESALDIAGVLEAQAAPFLARTAARAPTLRLQPIEPVVTANLVVAAIGDDDGAHALAEEVARVAPALLAEAGWRVEGSPDAPALTQVGVAFPGGLPTEAGLPPAGTLFVLLQLAQEVGR
ncbi:MAG: hypothetical protein WD250_06770 [Egibacteraceae bacterium]